MTDTITNRARHVRVAESRRDLEADGVAIGRTFRIMAHDNNGGVLVMGDRGNLVTLDFYDYTLIDFAETELAS